MHVTTRHSLFLHDYAHGSEARHKHEGSRHRESATRVHVASRRGRRRRPRKQRGARMRKSSPKLRQKPERSRESGSECRNRGRLRQFGERHGGADPAAKLIQIARAARDGRGDASGASAGGESLDVSRHVIEAKTSPRSLRAPRAPRRAPAPATCRGRHCSRSADQGQGRRAPP